MFQFNTHITQLPAAAGLGPVGLDGIAILQVERVGGVGFGDPVAIDQEAHRVHQLALALAKGVHELLHRRRPLDLEVDLGAGVRHLEVDVGGVGLFFLSVLFLVGHVKFNLIDARRYMGTFTTRVELREAGEGRVEAGFFAVTKQ